MLTIKILFSSPSIMKHNPTINKLTFLVTKHQLYQKLMYNDIVVEDSVFKHSNINKYLVCLIYEKYGDF